MQSKPLNSADVVFAIDIGANSPHTGSDGITYSADKFYDTNTIVADYLTNADYQKTKIKFTFDQPIYMTERHSSSSFKYYLPVSESGDYVLILKFCELYFKKPNQRKMNIKFGSTVVVENLDIVGEVGPLAAFDKYIQFSVNLKSKTINFNNLVIQDAFSDKGKLILEFAKTSFDLPKVDGMILYKGKLEDTNYDEYRQTVDQWEEKMREQQKILEAERKKKEEKRKQLQLDEVDFSLESFENKSIFFDVLGLLFGSVIGYCIMAVLALFLMCQYLTENQDINKKNKIK